MKLLKSNCMMIMGVMLVVIVVLGAMLYDKSVKEGFADKSNKDKTFISKTDDAIYNPELASKKVFELLISISLDFIILFI